MFAGGACIACDCSPTKPPWSEVIVFWDLFLRQINSLQEEILYRRRDSCQRAQFRQTNVRRRRGRGARPYSGEAAVVGGDDLLVSPPPAEQPLPEETAISDKRDVHRKTDSASEISSGERMFAGGEGVVRGLTPVKPPWSKVIVFRGSLLRHSIP